MPDFNVRSDSVNVEQIMEQIRARIREKRGVDYTEQQIRDLAAVKLEKFLDPKGVRSDLLEQYRKIQPAYEPPELPNYEFEEGTLYETHRGLLRSIRKLLNPLLKLFFNPNKLVQALHIQARLNTMYAEREARREAARRASDQLTYELIHNLVVETTRLGIEAKNLKMRAESLASRLEFNERRARALESVVVYKADEGEAAPPPRPAPAPVSIPAARPASAQPAQPGPSAGVPAQEGPGQRSRRRRRRRGRRSGGPAAAIMGSQPSSAQPQPGAPDESGSDDRDAADESPDANGTATEDLAQFSGAAAHPSEPVAHPSDGDTGQGPSKTDPDTQ